MFEIGCSNVEYACSNMDDMRGIAQALALIIDCWTLSWNTMYGSISRLLKIVGLFCRI